MGIIKLKKHKIREGIIVRETIFRGIGLHTGKEVVMKIKNNPSRDGITFIYNGIKKNVTPFVLNTRGRTTSILHNKKVLVICIEHLMSALSGLGVSNAVIRLIGGPEVPILAGNSFSFVESLLPNLIYAPSEGYAVTLAEPLIIKDRKDSSRYIRLLPSKSNILHITSFVSYEKSFIRGQRYTFAFNNAAAYIKEISYARTSFPFKIGDENDYSKLHTRLKGVVVTGEARNINTYVNRSKQLTFYKNEVARHKILDFLGDLKSLGVPLVGTKVELTKTGHTLNIALARTLKKLLNSHLN